MIQKRLGMLATILVLCGTLGVLAQTKGKKTTPYCSIDELPDACVYLPAPPDVTEAAFVDDYNQYLWGKSVRPTARGKRASWEARFGVARMATVYGEAMNITISQQGTPALWRFIQRVGDTGSRSTTKAKRNYMRVRPFARMNEPMASEFDDEKGLRTNGSYPSGHTGLGWAVALAMAEMAPEYQDTILRRGFEYGQNRVIVGAHWQSDVDAGYLTASAAYARMHTSPEYWADLKEARAEYRRMKGMRKEPPFMMGYPKGKKVLDAPIDTASSRFQGDWTYYWLAKRERNTERGWQAVRDTACSESAFLQCFAPCVDVPLDGEETPAIAALVSKVYVELCSVTTEAKTTGFRKRPFVQFGDETPVPELEKAYVHSSSYPSAHALLGWGIALALVEVMPDFQNAILTRGFEYGRSRVILGLHYASDVQAGRILAACALARMHNDESFLRLMEAAKREYAQVKVKLPVRPAAKVSSLSANYFLASWLCQDFTSEFSSRYGYRCD